MAWQPHSRESSLGIMDGVAVSILWLWTRKLQRKVLILCDMLGKLGSIIRNKDSFTGCLNGWEGHESGWRNVKGRELKFSSCCDQMFSGFQRRLSLKETRQSSGRLCDHDPPVAHRLIGGASLSWPVVNFYPAILRYSKITDLNLWGRTLTLTMQRCQK